MAHVIEEILTELKDFSPAELDRILETAGEMRQKQKSTSDSDPLIRRVSDGHGTDDLLKHTK